MEREVERQSQRAWLRERVLVDGGPTAVARGIEWADALGVELVTIVRRGRGDGARGRTVVVPRTFRPARAGARLVVVDAGAGRVRWRVRRAVGALLIARPSSQSGRILVAVDFGDPAEHVLAMVARLARRQRAAVTLLHSIEPGVAAAEWMSNFGGSDWVFVSSDAASRREAAERRLSELLIRYQLAGRVEVGDAPAARLILDVAARDQPDLIAVGAPRQRGLLRVFSRSVADEVAASSTTSVLIVPWVRFAPPVYPPAP